MIAKKIKYSILAICIVPCMLTMNWGCKKPQTWVIVAGWDLFQTNEASFSFNGLIIELIGIPFETFDFGGSIGAKDVDNTDTVVRRTEDATGTQNQSTDVIPIEVQGLQFRTKNKLDLGQGLDYHYTTLDSTQPSSGSMVINFANKDEGTFNSMFTVFFNLRKGSVTGPIVASNLSIELFGNNIDWARVPQDNAFECPGVNVYLTGFWGDTKEDFWPQGNGCDGGGGSCHEGPTPDHRHCVCPAEIEHCQ